MRGYGPATYGEEIAYIYDEPDQTPADTAAAAAFLLDLARRVPDGPRLLEFGVGTGRVALPLADLGAAVTGVDCSERMLARCRDKAPGAVRLVHDDLATVRVEPAGFGVVYAVYNTLFHLRDQEEQLAAFTTAAAHLAPGGYFVVQADVPDLTGFVHHQRTRVFAVRVDEVDLDVNLHDPVRQTFTTQYLLLSGGGVRLHPLRQRYAWPSELDLMARIAGLHPVGRHAGFTREEFTVDSRSHVSVYRLGDDG